MLFSMTMVGLTCRISLSIPAQHHHTHEQEKSFLLSCVAEAHWSECRIWIVETSIKVSGTFVTQDPHPHRLPALLNVPLSLNKCKPEQDHRVWDI